MSARLPDGLRVYAIGDIHGMLETLRELQRMIEADLDVNPVERAVEVLLGDYIDRGPDSAALIERLATEDSPRERVTLRGNHEEAMLEALHSPERLRRWLGFGGRETLASYGIAVDELVNNPAALQTQLNAVLPPHHLSFLSGLPLTHQIGETLFVHAGIRPGVPIEEQAPSDLLWIRDEFLEYEGPLPVHVVHGHTPTERPVARPHRTNVDTGAVYGGALTAAVVENGHTRFLSVPTG